MSTAPAVTMQELELETAELLPARETLWSSHSYSSRTSIDSGNGNHDGNGNGNGNYGGLVIAGNGNGNLDGNTVVLF